METRNREVETEMFQHVELWQQGQLTQQEYSKSVGIPCSKFKYWRKKYLEQNIANTKGRKSTSIFLPLKTVTKKLPELTLQYPNGVQVQCPSDIDLQVLKQLIEITTLCLP
jgi:hypothetical protein